MYEALYRKWRPLTFDDVISQEHVTTTLKNQIVRNQTAHAYIFTGSRGTGKTTCARIFAKALNCENPVNGNPCLECEICKNADRLTDIIEIDAASNNGVDSIREIREGLDYMPERCRYKVYIIDEVHMLSNQAFNAFLKSIEEPPPHVKFIFATTEIHKVPATILSRCQRFDFKRVKTSDIADRIKYIISKEGLEITDEAAMLIGKISDGGMRDALSLLDLCTAVSKEITEEVVSQSAGIADREYLITMTKAILEKDTSLAISTINDLYDGSMDLQNLSVQLTEQFRNLMLLKLNPPQKEAVSCSEQEIEKLLELSKNVSLTQIMNLLSGLQKVSSSLANSVNKRADFEMGIIFALSDETGKSENSASSVEVEKLNEKIRFLEQKVRTMSKGQYNAPQVGQMTESGKVIPEAPDPNTVDYKTLKKEDFHPVTSWNEVLDKFKQYKPDVVGSLGGSAAFINKNVMLIVTDNPFFIHLFKDQENAEILRRVIYEILGKNYIIKAKCNAKSETQTPAQKADEFLNKAQDNGINTVVNGDNPK
jgi:DNA polymerase-3 subunit gamma/tau